MTDLEKALQALKALLEQADEGPRHCVGVMQDGTWTWKGSFLAKLEALRPLVTPDA